MKANNLNNKIEIINNEIKISTPLLGGLKPTFNGAFGGTNYESTSNTYTFPSGAQSWAGFANTNTDIYPLKFTANGKITFTANVPSGNTCDIRFKFEKNPHPDVEPSYNTSSVTVSGSSDKEYVIDIPSQGSNTFRSFLLYLNDVDVPVIIKNISVFDDRYEFEEGQLYGTFGRATYDDITDTYEFPSGAQSWAGFANTNRNIYPLNFPYGGKVFFKAKLDATTSSTSANIKFKFEYEPFPDVDPSFYTDNIEIIGTTEKEYFIQFDSQGTNTFSSFLLYIVEKDIPIIIKDIYVLPYLSSSDFDSEPESEPSGPPSSMINRHFYSVWGGDSSYGNNISIYKFNPNWGQTTSVDTSGDYLKYSKLNYQGTEIGTAIDLTDKTFMHIDLWSSDITTINIFLISDTSESGYAVTLKANEWNTFNIPLSYYSPTVDLSNVNQFKIDNGGGGTLFIDNWYFYKQIDFSGFKWNYEITGDAVWPHNDENQIYTDINANINTSNELEIKLTKTSTGFYSSRLFTTEDSSGNKISLDAGKKLTIEFTAKIPNYLDNDGNIIPLWPALWMLGEGIYKSGDSEIPWAKCGEIDIMEWAPTSTDKGPNKYGTAIHWDNGSNTYLNNIADIDPTIFNTFKAVIYHDNLSEYGVIEMYINDTLLHKYKLDSDDEYELFKTYDSDGNKVSDSKNYALLINLAFAGNYTNNTQTTEELLNSFNFTEKTMTITNVSTSLEELTNNEFSSIYKTITGQLSGTKWRLKQQEGALKVGPTQGSDSSWYNSIEDIANRDFANDFFEFYSDGSFVNNLGYRTFLEPWQYGGSDYKLGTPVYPHDGSTIYQWVYNSEDSNIKLTGVGAFLGLPKVINGNEISNNNEAPASRTYIIDTLTTSELIVDINVGSEWWRFEFEHVENLSTTSPQVPDPVTYATISGGIREATINWTGDNSNTGYSISIKDDSTSKVDLPRDIIDNTNASRYGEYTFTGLDNGTSYTFVIKAKNAAGESTGVETDVVITRSLPSPPSLTSTRTTDSVLLEWTGNSADTGYIVSIDGVSGSEVTLGAVSEYTFTGLTNGNYTFLAKSIDAVGTSATASSTTINVPLPSPPSTLIATKKLNSVLLEWTGNSTDTGYVISIDGQSGSDVTLGIVSEYTYTGLTAGETYKFVIKAIDAVGTGTYTTTSNEVTLPVISTVSNVVLSINLNTVKITFDSTEDDEFKNTYSVTSNIGSLSYTPTGKEITITDAASNGFSYGRYYDFNVVATNDVGSSTSVKSNTVKFHYKSTNYKDDKSHYSVTKKAAINQLGSDQINTDCVKFDKTGKYMYITYFSENGSSDNSTSLYIEKRDLDLNLQYKKEFKDQTNPIKSTKLIAKDDNIYVVGYSWSTLLILIKVSDTGSQFNEDFFKLIEKSESIFWDIDLDNDNNIYCYGTTDIAPGDVLSLKRDIILHKYNGNDGSNIWEKQFGTIVTDQSRFGNLCIKNNRIFVHYMGYIGDGSNVAIFVLEIDTDGNILKTYDYKWGNYGYTYYNGENGGYRISMNMNIDDNFNIYINAYKFSSGYGIYKFKFNETTNKLEEQWHVSPGIVYHEINIFNNKLYVNRSSSNNILVYDLDGNLTNTIFGSSFSRLNNRTFILNEQSYFLFGFSTTSIAAENPDTNRDIYMLKIEESTYIDNLTINENKTLSIKLD